jgi:tetratricopeptide (TPR) repeat protein
MRQLFSRYALALFILFVSTSFMQAQTKKEPLSKSELIALVAGNSLNEDVVLEIEMRGLAFHPSDPYRSLVYEAGGDARVLAALGNAKIIEGGMGPDSDAVAQLLRHLSTAGKLIRTKQYDEATKELTAALQSGGGPEAGFVMGKLLHNQEQWPQAALIYGEVLHQDPEFTEAHIKLSYILYRLGDPEGALREAKSALEQSSGSAEAHQIAGVAFAALQKSTAAEQEYREALRLKPDYALAHYDLGALLYSRGAWDQSIAEYKKSIALDPTDEREHYNLAMVYSEKGDSDSAIREYREAKRINPKMLWARQNLGNELMTRNMNAEAIAELRELEAMAPDFAS